MYKPGRIKVDLSSAIHNATLKCTGDGFKVAKRYKMSNNQRYSLLKDISYRHVYKNNNRLVQ